MLKVELVGGEMVVLNIMNQLYIRGNMVQVGGDI